MVRNTMSAVIALAAAGSAQAGVAELVASFGFTDLNGSYLGTTNDGTFTATAAGAGAASTAGDVTRLLGGVSQTAEFDADFADDADESGVLINISVEEMGSEIVGSGSFEITDADGDTIAGEITGEWLLGPFGFVFFNGMIESAAFASDGDTDAAGAPEALEFDGPSGGSFSFADILGNLNGAFSLLFNEGDAFTGNFEGASVQGDGLLIPGPGSAAIAGLGVLVAARRRRA